MTFLKFKKMSKSTKLKYPTFLVFRMDASLEQLAKVSTFRDQEWPGFSPAPWRGRRFCSLYEVSCRAEPGDVRWTHASMNISGRQHREKCRVKWSVHISHLTSSHLTSSHLTSFHIWTKCAAVGCWIAVQHMTQFAVAATNHSKNFTVSRQWCMETVWTYRNLRMASEILTDWVTVLRRTWHKISKFGDAIPRWSLG